MPNEHQQPTGERLAIVEAQLSDIKAALIRMDAKLDAWHTTYIPRSEVAEMFRARDESISDLKKEVAEIREERRQGRSIIPQWVSVSIMLLSVAVATIELIKHP